MGRISTSIDDIYLTICKDLLKAPKVGNTRELNNVKLVLKNVTNNIVSVRDLSPSYLAGELLWYFNGSKALQFISQFSSFWKHISDDGITCNSGYGYLIQNAHDLNQIEKVVDILLTDPNSRRAKININTPNARVKETLDEPCTMSLHFMIRKNKLYCTTVMRSNDIWFGLPYDVAFFTTLQKYIAKRLGIKCGDYTHFVVSLHMYDKDAEKISEIVANPVSKPILFDSDKFFEHFERIYTSVCSAIRQGVDAKQLTMRLFKEYGIYKEEENE